MNVFCVYGIIFSVLVCALILAVYMYKSSQKKLDDQVKRGAVFKPKDSSPWTNDQLVIIERKLGWVRYVSVVDYKKTQNRNVLESKVEDLLNKCDYAGIYDTK